MVRTYLMMAMAACLSCIAMPSAAAPPPDYGPAPVAAVMTDTSLDHAAIVAAVLVADPAGARVAEDTGSASTLFYAQTGDMTSTASPFATAPLGGRRVSGGLGGPHHLVGQSAIREPEALNLRLFLYVGCNGVQKGNRGLLTKNVRSLRVG